MTRTTPQLRSVAEHLLRLESLGAVEQRTAASRVCEKLRRSLGKLLGAAGFLALLTRALTMAKAEAPELSAVQAKSDGTLDNIVDLDRAGEIALVAQLLGLLVMFIGAAVTIRILQDAWPKANLKALDQGRDP